ncbi:MAG: ferritin-like domain-containing protein [Gemmatimonadales bacterium]|nr:ferritin-like domain-containing protein [Gemmatimonadales bacterium]
MPHETFHDLYVDELRDLWSAEKQLLAALPRMAKAASSAELQQAFKTHEEETAQHVKRLEEICRSLEVSPRGKRCVGMDGLIAEGKEMMSNGFDGTVLDAGLIAAAQRVEHYEIAGYGTARSWAEQLGYDDQAQLLQATLDEESATNETLTGLARTINFEADEDAEDN